MALRFVKGLERAVSGCGQPMDGVYLLVESVHSPYCQLLVKYHSMEQKLLRQQLHSIQLVSALTLSPSLFNSPPPLPPHSPTHTNSLSLSLSLPSPRTA